MQLVAANNLTAFMPIPRPGFLKRLASRKGAILLFRNTVVSVLAFFVGLALMALMVELMGAHEMFAAGASFLVATSLHYAFGRAWVFRGTERGLATGYGYFLINAGIGLALTVSLFAALLSWTPMHYLVARVIASVFAGFAMFVVNSTLNFKQL